MKKAITYYRVSTPRQGASGLGLAAQKRSVKQFASANGYGILGEYIEIESGKKNNRPLLAKAILDCKKHGATLLIAKLDRLGRNVAFISSLMEAQIDFVAVDNPTANKFVVHVMAAFAEYERDQISLRTREALKAAKLRGVALGKYAADVLSRKNRAASLAFAKKMHPLVRALRREGHGSVRGMTAELNRRGVATFRGFKGRWHKTTVQNLLKKIEALGLK